MNYNKTMCSWPRRTTLGPALAASEGQFDKCFLRRLVFKFQKKKKKLAYINTTNKNLGGIKIKSTFKKNVILGLGFPYYSSNGSS